MPPARFRGLVVPLRSVWRKKALTPQKSDWTYSLLDGWSWHCTHCDWMPMKSLVTREVIGTRCERGAEIARMLELPEATQAAIRALDEHWDGAGQPLGLRGEEIPLLGRILCLAQTLEVFVRTVGLPGALAMALKRRGRWFDPALVDALLAIRDDRRFWGPFEDPRMVPLEAAATDGPAWTADLVASADDGRVRPPLRRPA